MKNKCLPIMVFFIFVSAVSFAQEAPMKGWKFNTANVTLNGRMFWNIQYPESWREQEGFALVSGQKIQYWLYDSYSYHNGKADVIYNRIVPLWVERMGYVIDFDNIKEFNPNPDIASSVKALMTQRGADVSVTLITNSEIHFVAINKLDKETEEFSTTIYYLHK